jgi:hypothetical protein
MLIPQFEPLIVRSVSEKGYIKSKKTYRWGDNTFEKEQN